MGERTLFFYSDHVKYAVKGKRKISRVIDSIINDEKRQRGVINVILCSDRKLLSINKEHLNKKDYTDIITFDFCEGKFVAGDLYISIDRIRDNAGIFGVRISDELCRVILHGVLHLCGYEDATRAQRENMKHKEDYYLSLL